MEEMLQLDRLAVRRPSEANRAVRGSTYCQPLDALFLPDLVDLCHVLKILEALPLFLLFSFVHFINTFTVSLRR